MWNLYEIDIHIDHYFIHDFAHNSPLFVTGLLENINLEIINQKFLVHHGRALRSSPNVNNFIFLNYHKYSIE